MKDVETTVNNFKKYTVITEVIDDHINAILKDTMFDSHSNGILKHPRFAELVAMSDGIVNYIFHKMFQHGNNRIYLTLLHKIVPNPPTIPEEHRGRFMHMTVDWMSWYLESEYYKNNNIYHGLISSE